MDDDRIRSILIVGGGIGGWLAAATLARRLDPAFCTLRVLEVPTERPDPFAVVTLPSFRRLLAVLGIDERQLLLATGGTCSLGTEFRDWHRLGDAYFHGFGSVGAKLEAVPFHQHWARLQALGEATPLEEYSTAAVAARAGRFSQPSTDPRSVLSLYSYGYHLESASLAAVLRHYAEGRGVVALAGEIADAVRREPDGWIESLELADGTRAAADLFVDCGAGLNPLGGWVDWSRWLPCDRAIALQRPLVSPAPPCAEIRAVASGWDWQIPLRHCIDAGYAYSSRHSDPTEAEGALERSLASPAAGEIRHLKFKPGRPERTWRGNCVSLATNALAPLEATALHLIQTAVARLLSLFPVRRFSPPDIAEFNRLTALEHDRVRDLMILHYAATARVDSPFWNDCRQLEVPETLSTKVELFRRCGRIAMFEEEHFSEDSWLTVLVGQGVLPESHDPLADVLPVDDTRAALLAMRLAIRDAVATLPPSSDAVGPGGGASAGTRTR